MAIYDSDAVAYEVKRSLKDKILSSLKDSYRIAHVSHMPRHVSLSVIKDYFAIANRLINNTNESFFSADHASTLAQDLFIDMDSVLEKMIKDSDDDTDCCMYGLSVIDGQVSFNVVDKDLASHMWGVRGERELATDEIKTYFDGEKLELIPRIDDESENGLTVVIDRDDDGTFSAHLMGRDSDTDLASVLPKSDMYDNDEIYFVANALVKASAFITKQYHLEQNEKLHGEEHE